MTRSISGPGGSNEYSNAIDSASVAQDNSTGIEATGSFPSKPRRVGHTIRSVSGPSWMSADPQSYKGT